MTRHLRSVPKGQPVPAISLRQPWAGAVAWLKKTVENRSRWPFAYRGPIIIHASASATYEDFDRLRAIATTAVMDPTFVRLLDPDSPRFPEDVFPMGCSVAVAILKDVFGPKNPLPRVQSSPWISPEAAYHLELTDVEPVIPVPYKGAVGLFKIPYEVARELEPEPD